VNGVLQARLTRQSLDRPCGSSVGAVVASPSLNILIQQHAAAVTAPRRKEKPMAKFWGVESTDGGCATSPDGLTHVTVTIYQRYRFWRAVGSPWAEETVGAGPCPIVVSSAGNPRIAVKR
jgi:hypothetical protein